MIHARADYDRFREPDELADHVRRTMDDLIFEIRTRTEVRQEDGSDQPTAEGRELVRLAKAASEAMTATILSVRPSGSRIAADEPVMIFRAQDTCFCKLLAYYCLLLVKADAEPELVACVARHVRRAAEWRAANPVKVPDAPAEALR